jgi:cysteine desulfurase
MSDQDIQYPIYLDYQSTTPVDPRVIEAMQPYFSELFGNSASKSHQHGHDALAGIEKARKQIAKAINAKPQEIVFTSGATESINLAIKGMAFSSRTKGNHYITVATEHKAVLDCFDWLERNGFETTILPVDSEGMLTVDDVVAAIRPETAMVAVMAANNEIGVVLPINEIGQACRERGVHFFTDATQALGKIPLDVQAGQIDLLCGSGHKVYGPKGVGMLYVRRSNPRVHLEPLIHGGGHEGGLRSGTLATPLIVGFGEAVELSCKEMKKEAVRLEEITQKILAQLKAGIPGLMLNGHPSNRLPGSLNVSLGGVSAEAVVAGLSNKVSLSTGSACTSKEVLPSHVLSALGIEDAKLVSSLRLSLGRQTRECEAVDAISLIKRSVLRLEELSF